MLFLVKPIELLKNDVIIADSPRPHPQHRFHRPRQPRRGRRTISAKRPEVSKPYINYGNNIYNKLDRLNKAKVIFLLTKMV